ncbi:hypothetical protein [uncultured Clostridium sp.]|uniref:hypothetical protein n=1 Tax=uncultured Clostridium sp. TaxID=59620 RepID=UPI002630BB56|nr:hypothetical protein [uncultured Clostridium sp.]
MRRFEKINEKEVLRALNRREMEIGIDKYEFIMKRFWHVDVRKDNEFKRVFIDFYKLINLNGKFLEIYFETLENHKTIEYTYVEVLRILYKYSKKVHGSFASKLLATVDEELPIIDRFIKKHLELETYYSVGNVEKIIAQYDEVKDLYSEFLNTEQSKRWIELFDEKFSDRNISDIKKIDFILWQIR